MRGRKLAKARRRPLNAFEVRVAAAIEGSPGTITLDELTSLFSEVYYKLGPRRAALNALRRFARDGWVERQATQGVYLCSRLSRLSEGGERVRALREEAALSQQGLVEACADFEPDDAKVGMTRGMLVRIERGRRMSLAEAYLFAAVFDVPVWALFRDDVPYKLRVDQRYVEVG